MKELVEVIARALVDNPDEVVVTETEKEGGTFIELKMAPSDMGKVIGKQGRIAKAIRSVVANHMNRAVVNTGRSMFAIVISLILYAQLFCHLLQLTVSAADAGQTAAVMIGKQKLKGFFAGFQYLGGVGPYLHTLIDGVYTGNNQTSCSLDLHNTHTAGADLIDIL